MKKELYLNFFLIALALSFSAPLLYAADMTSSSFIIRDPIIGTSGGYGESASFEMFSSGNTLFSGSASSASFQARYGFLYYDDTGEPFLTFDIDTASDFSNGESSAPYTVELGALTTGSVKVSNSSTVQMIVAEGDTNAPGGMVVTVQNANGSNGLASASVPGDNINSSTAVMSAGTENYGLCVATSGLAGFSRASGYSGDTCALGSQTNGVQALSATPTAILNSAGAPVSGGYAEIVVNGAISGSTPAHSDYTDTLTFVVTGTF